MFTCNGISLSSGFFHFCSIISFLLYVSCRASFEHFVRISRAERRRAEKLVGGGSLGRSFSRSYAGGLAGEGGAMMQAAAPVQQLAGNEQEKERRRASLRVSQHILHFFIQHFPSPRYSWLLLPCLLISMLHWKYPHCWSVSLQ